MYAVLHGPINVHTHRYQRGLLAGVLAFLRGRGALITFSPRACLGVCPV